MEAFTDTLPSKTIAPETETFHAMFETVNFIMNMKNTHGYVLLSRSRNIKLIRYS